MKLLGPEINKIVVFRALQLGDMLCSIPAIRALHHAYPSAQITLIGLPWAKFLAERFPTYIHEVITFPGFPGLPEQPENVTHFPSFLTHVQQQHFDLAIQMQGSGGISNPLVKLFHAKFTAGFYVPGAYCPNELLFTPYPNSLHEIERHLELMIHLGIPPQGTDLEFPLTAEDEQSLQDADLPIAGNEYVCVHPGSRGEERRWPPQLFAAVADYCVEQGLQVVITGTKEEMPIVDVVVAAMKYPPIIAAGKTTLGGVGLLIKNAVALISNCTGVSHIAAALKTKSVVISLDGEPERWGPLNKDLHKTIDWTRIQDFQLVLSKTAELIGSRN